MSGNGAVNLLEKGGGEGEGGVRRRIQWEEATHTRLAGRRCDFYNSFACLYFPEGEIDGRRANGEKEAVKSLGAALFVRWLHGLLFSGRFVRSDDPSSCS